MAADPITLLHLSDPQFGRNHLFGSSGLTVGDQHFDSLFARLHADLRGLRESHGLRPDLVVISGDLAEWARPGEFKQVLRFLEEIADALELPRGRVVIVPGNHDINRAACQAYFLQCEASEQELKAPFWPKWEPFAAMFTRFYESEEAISFDVDQPWTLFELPELRLVVAGLNSSMAESHRDEDHYGWVGEQQLMWFAEQLRPYEQRGWMRIGVLHHNVVRGAVADDEHLRDFPDLERILAPRLNLLLHGHTHDAKRHRLGDLLVLSTGSAAVAAKARPAEVPNQYQVIRVYADRVERWGRCYALNDKRWIGDTRVTRDGNDWHDDQPERLHAVHGAFTGADADPDRRADRDSLQAGAREDEFAVRVAEVCAIRNPGVTVTHRAAPTNPPIPYLRVVVRDDGLARQYPIGVYEHRITGEELDQFVHHIHDTFRTADPMVVSKLVHGGPPADEHLVRMAWRQGVELVSFIEYQGVLDLRGYVSRQTARLQVDVVYPPQLYVPQRFRLLDAENGVLQDLLEQVLEWVDAPQGRFVLVLGDFGRGKTFLLHQLARRISEQLPHLIPVLIQLRALEKARTLDELVAQHLAAAGETRVDLHGFRYMLREGRVVLLFDGFDELALRVASYDRATDHLDTLLQAAEGRAKVVLSSRTQHFISDEQVTTALGERVELLPGRRLVSIADFDDGQIITFLTKLYDGDEQRAAKRLELLHDVRDLLGLSRNPRMLSFIADLPDDQLRQARKHHGEITSAELYRLLLERWLQYEQRRVQPKGAVSQLNVTERWEAATRLALRLWQTTERSIGLAELTSTVTDTLGELADRQVDLDQAAHAIGSGTLLVRSEEGDFTFVHQSVMEWLVARHAADAIHNGDRSPEVLTTRKMSALMADFVLGLLGREQGRNWANHVRTDPAYSDAAKANALLMLDRLGEEPLTDSQLARQDLRGASLSGRKMRGANLYGADLSEARLVGTDLTGADLRGASLRRTILNDAILVDADLTEADFTGARLLGADLRGARLDDSRWRRATLIGADIDMSTLVDLDTYGVAMPSSSAVPQILPSLRGNGHAISPDGELLAIAGTDSTITIVDRLERKPLYSLLSEQGAVQGVVFSPDGQQVASAGDDGTVRLWDLASGQALRTLKGHRRSVRAVVFSPDGQQVASAGDDGAVRLWDPASGQALRTLKGHRRSVRAVVFSPDGQQVASAGDDGTVRLWDPASGQALRTLEGHRRSVRAVVFSPDGQQVASAGDDGTVRLWDPASGHALLTLEGHTGGVNGVVFSPDGQQVASAGDDGTVRLWDPASGQALRTLEGHQNSVQAVVFSPDGQQVVSAGTDKTVRLWNPMSGDLLSTIRGHKDAMWGVAFSPNGQQLASTGTDGTVRLWNPMSGDLLHTIRGHKGSVFGLVFSPDGQQLASAGNDGTVRLWDPASGQALRTLEGHQNSVWGLVFSPDGQQVASAGDDGTVRLWDPASGQALRTLEGHQNSVWGLVFSPDGQQVASAGDDGTVRLWDPASGQALRTLEGHKSTILGLVFSPDGQQLASAGSDGTVRLWDPASGQALRTLKGHQNSVWGLVFSPDGQQVASAGDDGTVRLWDPASGQALHILRGHQGALYGLAISPDGQQLASAGSDGTVRLWNSHPGAWLLTLLPLSDGWVAITADGRYKIEGTVEGGFWFAAGLTRFEPGELDHYIHSIRREPKEAPLSQ